MQELFMGIDIGTSSIRAALFNTDGELKAMHQKEYTLISETPMMAELDPQVVFNAFKEVVSNCYKEACGAKICGAGFSTQIHSLLAVDAKGECLTNLFTWADLRPIDVAKKAFDKELSQKLYEITGCRAQHPMYPLSKILWLKEENKEVFEKTYKFIPIKSYILSKLYDEFVIDYTDASATAIFDIHNFKWSDFILDDILKMNKDKLAEAVPITYTLTNMKDVYKNELGFAYDIPFTIGSGDGMLANLGSGVFDESRLSCTVGTSGAVRTATTKPVIDEKGRTWCYCFTKDIWVSGGAINNGGIVQKWLRDEFKDQFDQDAKELGLKNSYKLFDHYAKDVPAGANGLTFLPFLTGERSPGWHADAQGMLCGLKLMHKKSDIIKAAMEGVMFNMYSIFLAVTSISEGKKTIMASGGYVNSKPWLQIQADLFNADIHISEVSEASVLGAAYTAMVANGVLKDFNVHLKVMDSKEIIKPNAENFGAYQDAYKTFLSYYDKLIGD